MSAGNYGRSFAYASNALGLKGNIVLMPETAPDNREVLIKNLGVDVRRFPSSQLVSGVKKVGNLKVALIKGLLNRHFMLFNFCSLKKRALHFSILSMIGRCQKMFLQEIHFRIFGRRFISDGSRQTRDMYF